MNQRNASVLRVLRVTAGDSDLVLRPVDVAVLDPQHFALPAAGFKGTDDPVVHRGAHPPVLGRVHRVACGE
ncbi:MAG: hypothetical protein FJW27_01475 [Acidimicrobiia bacterium]|nr:hypothetical protein [Acidimicrobiia bacterium]